MKIENLYNTEPFRSLFDEIWVLSLKSSIERRQHIRDHLPRFGITKYRFFDAIGADHPEIEAVEQCGGVVRYPPCFRCGKLDCGNDDCNNFLVPEQIACFLSYRRLWRTIAEGTAEKVLIMEDDVWLHPQTYRVLSWVQNEVEEGRIPFSAGKNCLLRFGWAKCGEHLDSDAPVKIAETVKMANPCHAITRSYAAALIERDGIIRHTADVYQHQLAPKPGESFSIFPPIASELSWAEGQFPSTIHPKKVHVDYLHKNNDISGANAASALLKSHIKKKFFRTLLITGHPRCGTGYASALCRQMGLDVGHEKAGRDGISSWMFAVEDKNNPWALDLVSSSRLRLAWKYLIMPVRDLGKAAESVVRENTYAPASYQFRQKHILARLNINLDGLSTDLEKSVCSIVGWARIVLNQTDFVFRIEDEQEKLREYLINLNLIDKEHQCVSLNTSPVNADKLYKGKHYNKPTISIEDWQALPHTVLTQAAWYCEQFGYFYPWEHGQ
ncbi:glycosyltransferase family 25 protein [Thiorhodococcus minor]|uniref:Glycosyltransferase family 25 protein n=1 Tax=Thiorhodococcus minor TaxID=57489 RepID=A0A6M0K7H0_9GAMM|nr:glycosyltransferase family 25 protein [Thiorhodococcus minor]NEV65331.1 glycosyltransferase family 25 protein [Thiorhodococcus minor]